MGGSRADPDSRRKRHTKQKKKDDLDELRLYIKAYVWQVGLHIRAWNGSEYGTFESINWLKKIQKKLTAAEELEKDLHTGESWLIPMNLTRRVRSLYEEGRCVTAKEHFEMLEVVTNGILKRMDKDEKRRNNHRD